MAASTNHTSLRIIMGYIIGFLVAAVIFVAALRHARKKPQGKIARAIEMASGGGPGVPDEKVK
jgi:hypothetical protein